ncbi:MAG: hypothetical protein GMKNLPBB_02017 [Myxococcota bacterium]|nr:hypothetical protein [Myxococcota bacterium]
MFACSLISCQASIPPITLNNVVTACGSGDCKSENSSTNNTAANQSQGFGADAGLNGNISLDGGFGVGGGAGNGDSGNGGGNNPPPFDAGRTDSGISDAGGGDLESGFTFVNSRYPGDTLPPMDDPLECNPIHSGSGIPDIQGQYLFIPIKGDINADICQGFPPTGGPSLFDITQTGDCLSLSQRGVSTHVKAGVTLRAKNNYLKALFRNQENQGGYPVTGVDIHDLTIKGDNEILADVLLIRTFPQDPSTGQCSARVSGRLIRVPDDCGTVTAASLEYGSATTPGTVADSDWYGSSVTLRGRTENTLCNVPAQTINFSPGVGIFINPAGATANGCVRMVASALNVFECNGMVFPLPGTAKEFGFICNAPIQSGVRTLTAQLFGVLAPNSTASGGVLQVVIPLLSDTPNPFNEYCHVSIRGNLGPVADSSPLSYRFASHFIQELKPLHAVERRFETVNDNGDLPDIWVAGKDPNILEFDKAAVTAAATLNPVGYSEIRGMHLGTDGVLRVVGNSADGKRVIPIALITWFLRRIRLFPSPIITRTGFMTSWR